MDLLVDLLEHQMSETLFLSRLRVPRYSDRISFYRNPILRFQDPNPVWIENGHFPFLQNQRFPGQGKEGGYVAGAVVFSISQSEDERAFLAGAENRLRLLNAGQNDGVGSFQPVDGFPKRFFETEPLAEIFLDHVRDNFRVRSRGEPVPFGFELAFEIEIIFYYPVVDDGDPGFAIDQRVRVLFDWSAMSCPAGMSNAHGSGQEVEVVPGVDLIKSSTILLYSKSSIRDRYLADRVIPSIF